MEKIDYILDEFERIRQEQNWLIPIWKIYMGRKKMPLVADNDDYNDNIKEAITDIIEETVFPKFKDAEKIKYNQDRVILKII